jgi:hypothetical protein
MVPDWSDASCANEDPELFFPAEGQGPGAWRQDRAQAALARGICLTCPHIIQCFQVALTDGWSDGVRGGAWMSNGSPRTPDQVPLSVFDRAC